MGQLGFFDADKRLAALSAKGDLLEAIDEHVGLHGCSRDAASACGAAALR